MPEDLYELLGVGRDADLAALKRAFRARVKELHPDHHPGSARHEARFKAVSRAYAVLTSPEERAAYDRRSGRARPRRAKVADVRLEPAHDLTPLRGPTNGLEMLESFFRRKSHPSDAPGEDRHATIVLPLGEALRGTTLALDGLGPTSVEVTLPRGTLDGDRVRILGAGSASLGLGPPGDLWLHVRVEPHAQYRVEGRDLHVEARLTLAEAYLGTRLAIPTPTGTLDVRVPPRTAGSAVPRVKGRGVPASPTRGETRPGALFVHVHLALPDANDPEVARLLERLSALSPPPAREPLHL